MLNKQVNDKIKNLEKETQLLKENQDRLKVENLKLQGNIELLLKVILLSKDQIDPTLKEQIEKISSQVDDIKLATDEKIFQLTQEVQSGQSAISTSVEDLSIKVDHLKTDDLISSTVNDLTTKVESLKNIAEEVNTAVNSMASAQINTTEEVKNEVIKLKTSFEQIRNTCRANNVIVEENSSSSEVSNGEKIAKHTSKDNWEGLRARNNAEAERRRRVANHPQVFTTVFDYLMQVQDQKYFGLKRSMFCLAPNCSQKQFAFKSQQFFVEDTEYYATIRIFLHDDDNVHFSVDLTPPNKLEIYRSQYFTIALANEKMESESALNQCRIKSRVHNSLDTVYERFSKHKYSKCLCSYNDFYLYWVDQNFQISMYAFLFSSKHGYGPNIFATRLSFIHCCDSNYMLN
ncbi:hypothetical protein CHUAL_008025 [Chamberlinius hualienensis]